MKVISQGVVHPWLCDVMGHMTTRNYLAMFDDASYHMIFQAFGRSGGDAEFREMGWVDVRQVLEYKDELKAGSLVEIKGQLNKIGGKSAVFYYEMYNKATGALSATLETTSVYFDLKARVGAPITDAMRAQADEYTAEG